VDDDEGLLMLMGDALRAEGHAIAIAQSGRAALKWLEDNEADLMLLDLKMGEVDGPALLDKTRRGTEPVPFIIVTGQGDEKVAVELMKKGALDYVMKNTALLDLLPGVVRRTLLTLEQRKALAKAHADHLRLEAEILAASERERLSIGSDLHDGLGQQLTAIEFMCASLREDAAGRHPHLAARVEQISARLREAVALTRNLSRGLVPVGSGPDALRNGLAELAERTSEIGGVLCRFECNGIPPDSDVATAGHLFRIAQEATNNAVKHAHAGRVAIRLTRRKGKLLLEISDNGTGFPPDVGGRRGLGLGLMRHRANAIGGTLTVTSKKGEGVSVLCTLPLKQ
jgi:signal transduction histidine kinase